MKDNYARNVSLSCLLIIVLISMPIGIMCGITIIKVEDKINENHRDNLLILYDK
jgi:hypothetical protein